MYVARLGLSSFSCTPKLTRGGTRSVHLERQGLLSEEVVRFYISEIALAIDYLHSKKIVHR
jgi:serine/threonine kinase 32